MESVANSSCTRSEPDILAIIKFDPYRLRNKANIYQRRYEIYAVSRLRNDTYDTRGNSLLYFDSGYFRVSSDAHFWGVA